MITAKLVNGDESFVIEIESNRVAQMMDVF